MNILKETYLNYPKESRPPEFHLISNVILISVVFV